MKNIKKVLWEVRNEFHISMNVMQLNFNLDSAGPVKMCLNNLHITLYNLLLFFHNLVCLMGWFGAGFGPHA